MANDTECVDSSSSVGAGDSKRTCPVAVDCIDCEVAGAGLILLLLLLLVPLLPLLLWLWLIPIPAGDSLTEDDAIPPEVQEAEEKSSIGRAAKDKSERERTEVPLSVDIPKDK